MGWIFAQSTKEREFIMSSEEICQMAAVQVRAALWRLVQCWCGAVLVGAAEVLQLGSDW